jgi:hypothetical protein
MKVSLEACPDLEPWVHHLLSRRARPSFEPDARVPCPLCNFPLVIRMGRRGPYFSCGCPPREGNGHPTT